MEKTIQAIEVMLAAHVELTKSDPDGHGLLERQAKEIQQDIHKLTNLLRSQWENVQAVRKAEEERSAEKFLKFYEKVNKLTKRVVEEGTAWESSFSPAMQEDMEELKEALESAEHEKGDCLYVLRRSKK